MDWLKENDPITYYELTSNPTGADCDTTGITMFFICLMVIGVWGIEQLSKT